MEQTNKCPFCTKEKRLSEITEEELFALDDNKTFVCIKHQQEILDLIVQEKLK